MVVTEAGRARVTLREDVDVVRARQAALALARIRGFRRSDEARLDLVVAELSANVLRHALCGTITIAIDEERPDALVVDCLDDGPGMTPAPATSGIGLGLGLAAVRELSDAMEIRSASGWATWVRATVRIRSK